jgi:predicted TIM-barrel fold metal-dependent hydrolase
MTPLIDTHQHLLFGDLFSYEWVSGLPPLQSAKFTLDDYAKIACTEQITGSLFMEAAVDQHLYKDEADFVSGLCGASDKKLMGLVAAAYPENDGFDAWLAQSKDNSFIVGYRRVLHVVDNAMSQDQQFRDNVRKIGAAGKSFDMCFLERQLDLAIEFAAACDNTHLILDHCGNPEIAQGDSTHWLAKMRELAQMDHVICKISGLTNHCAAHQDKFEAVRPVIEQSIEIFGWDRVIWGSDWPVVNLGTGLADWMAITNKAMQGELPQNQQKLFHQNAERIFGVF